jgi:hypothetical protein
MNKKSNFINTFLTFIAFLLTLLQIISPAIAAYFGFDNPENFLLITLLFLTVFCMIFFYSKYYRKQKGEFPFADNVWALLTNIIPENPKSQQNNLKIKILIIYDEEKSELLNEIQTEYSKYKYVELMLYNTKKPKEKDFPQLFGISDGVLVCFSNTLFQFENNNFEKQLNSTSLQYSNIPVIAIVSDSSNYNLQFDHISNENIPEGIWRLLVRAKERGKLWKIQSQKLWLTSVTLITLITVSTLSYLILITSYNKSLNERNLIKPNNVRELALSIRPVRELLDSTNSNNKTYNTSLRGLLEYSLKDLIISQGGTPSNYKLTYWRAIDNQDILVECLWTGYHDPKSFKNNKTSIAGCSFSYPENVVVWKKEENGFSTIKKWNWKSFTKNFFNKIQIDETNDCEFKILKEYDDFEFSGIMCLSTKLPNTDLYSGMCLYSLEDNSLIDTQWTINKLINILTVFQLFPDSFFNLENSLELKVTE